MPLFFSFFSLFCGHFLFSFDFGNGLGGCWIGKLHVSFLIALMFFSFWPSRADARKLQQKQEESVSSPVPTEVRGATALAVQDQRKALKFGFSSKGGTSKVCLPSLSLSQDLGFVLL
jgi:hypothetical protein